MPYTPTPPICTLQLFSNSLFFQFNFSLFLVHVALRFSTDFFRSGPNGQISSWPVWIVQAVSPENLPLLFAGKFAFKRQIYFFIVCWKFKTKPAYYLQVDLGSQDYMLSCCRIWYHRSEREREKARERETCWKFGRESERESCRHGLGVVKRDDDHGCVEMQICLCVYLFCFFVFCDSIAKDTPSLHLLLFNIETHCNTHCNAQCNAQCNTLQCTATQHWWS